VVQTSGLKFTFFNTTSSKWESVAATLNTTNRTLITNAEITAYGNIALGYSSKRIYVDTRALDPVSFTITGAQLPSSTYISGQSGPSNDGLIPLLPVLPASGVSLITITMLAGNENEPIKMSFEIDNASNISNVNASMDNSATFATMDNQFYTINNTPANGKTIKFLRGDETPLPVFTTNLVDGTVFNNTGTNTFSIGGLTGYTITSFKILSLDDVVVKGPLTVAQWDGTNVSNTEVGAGVYKFELVITNNSTAHTFKGELIVR
jgi:hypothetical protein